MADTLFAPAMRGAATYGGAPFGYDIVALMKRLEEGALSTALYVARDDKQAASALKAAEFAAPAFPRIWIPAWDTLPYDRVSPQPALAAQRCAGLAELARLQLEEGRGALVVTTASSLVQRIPPAETLRRASLVIERGGTVSQDALQDYLGVNGYVRTGTVRERGEYAVRGGIIDIFAPTESEPVRLDFFGDDLDSLRSFDPESQRSTGELKTVSLEPVSEILFGEDVQSLFRERYLAALGSPSGDPMYDAARAGIRRQGIEQWLPLFHPQLETLFDLLQTDTVIALPALAAEAARERLAQAEDYHAARIEAAGGKEQAKVLEPSALHLEPAELELRLKAHRVARFSGTDALPGQLDLGAKAGRDFAPERAQNGTNIFEAAGAHAEALRKEGRAVVFAAWTEGSAQRLKGVLADHGLDGLARAQSLASARKASISVAELPLENGFTAPGLAVIAESDILGDRLAAPRRKRKTAKYIAEASALTAGDLVVHVEHGVGRYSGLTTLDVTGAPHACLELEYAAGDKVFLPVENIDLISRYGSDGAESAVDKLGGAGWQTRKAKAKKRILEMAAELMDIAAARKLKRADAVTTGETLYQEFAARFPYEETDDQMSAIEDVLGDLASGRPMDRLVCGDVGFGKTEVALRAAFMTAMGGMQVAVIAPTTLLARQHYSTFKERFSGWPLNVKPLSRLVAAKDAKATREGMTDGTVDVVIGTHALLASSVKFKRLGLLVVDEEQRFGVRHKERLKELKADVHVLTLSATPIPRTLQMALTGIRDLSIIATPPVDRLSVRTYVMEQDTVALREALLREKYRGGQAFYVAPRISDLEKLERFLKEKVPEVSFVVAHGQMSPSELEDIMTDFYEGKFDVLLSTTIVESGLDIPRANTLLIHRADRFGLAQLYQLRGRVGRSKLRAYAYFTTPKDQHVTPDAEKRLRVLQSLDSLGAGFQLASHDLDMRGGGNLLGDAQSGHVREVGVELYQQMLEDAVNALKADGGSAVDEVADDWSPSINVGAAVLIPEAYVPDLTERLALYRRLADVEDDQAREAFAAELIDRFGPMPEETQQLMEVAAVKAAAKSLGISKLDAGPKGAVFAFRDDTGVDPASLMRLVQQQPTKLKLKPDGKLVSSEALPDGKTRLKHVRTLLGRIADTTQAMEPA